MLLLNENIEQLKKQNEQFILGGRIRNENHLLQKQITVNNGRTDKPYQMCKTGGIF